ncbi:MAG: helix-turn-helix domain-containing protein [Candidatus Micrarchaeota archaeon]
MDSLKVLENIGLTSGEVRVYLALLKLGSVTTGSISSAAKVSSSKVYKILDRLEKKGLVGHVLKGEIKYFSANKPRRILDYIEEKQTELASQKTKIEALLPELEKQQELSESKSEAIIYEGFKGCTNFFRNIIEELKAGETYYVIGAGYGEDVKGLRDFFYKHHQRRTDKKINVKMLVNFDIKKTLVKTTANNSEIKFLPQYLITNMEIVFYKNKAFIVLWTKEPKGFLIENEEAVKSFKAYFDTLWKIAKK